MEDADSLAEFLPTRYLNVPLTALRFSSRKRLSQYLNMKDRLPLESNNLVPDFNGLSECIGFGWLDQQTFDRNSDPTAALLSEWTQRADLLPTVGNLVRHLLTLEREDILTDCVPSMLRDIEAHLNTRNQNLDSPIQVNEVTDSLDNTDHNVDEFTGLTVGEVSTGVPEKFDAFVSYSGTDSPDFAFVTTLIEELEQKKGLKLCIPWRDDLPGPSKHTTDAHLIDSRCRRMIVVLSRDFLKSPFCDFQLKYAHSLSPGARSKKVIPIIIERCEVPKILNQVAMCDYTKEKMTPWFWTRLVAAISAPVTTRTSEVSDVTMSDVTMSDVTLSDIKLNINPNSSSSGQSSSTLGRNSSKSDNTNHSSSKTSTDVIQTTATSDYQMNSTVVMANTKPNSNETGTYSNFSRPQETPVENLDSSTLDSRSDLMEYATTQDEFAQQEHEFDEQKRNSTGSSCMAVPNCETMPSCPSASSSFPRSSTLSVSSSRPKSNSPSVSRSLPVQRS